MKWQQIEPEPALEDEDESIATVLQEVIANEVENQVAKALATIPDITEEAVEQLFFAFSIVLKEESIA